MGKATATLKIAIVQTTLHWENSPANIAMLDDIMKGIKKSSVNVIALPEMFNTGFTMNAVSNFTTMDGPIISRMQNIAAKKNSALCGSMIIKDNGNYFNRFVWVDPDGKIQFYNKRHLFRMGLEHQTYTQGDQHVVINYLGWKIMPQVCYDLRFPVWSRNTFTNGEPKYDLLLYVANWPERRKQAWKQLLIARAIENQCYCVAVNRVGKDGNGLNHTGDSVALDFLGNVVCKIPPSRSLVSVAKLELPKLQKYRKEFPAYMDADIFSLK